VAHVVRRQRRPQFVAIGFHHLVYRLGLIPCLVIRSPLFAAPSTRPAEKRPRPKKN
jgi:hypothetical protein